MAYSEYINEQDKLSFFMNDSTRRDMSTVVQVNKNAPKDGGSFFCLEKLPNNRIKKRIRTIKKEN